MHDDSGPRLTHQTQLPSGSTVSRYDCLTSTSAFAKTQIDAGIPPTGPVWITADVQTGGVGRRGRAWHQAPGDFAGTLIINPDARLGALSVYSFIAALAVRDAIATHLDPRARASVKTKWPNDILIDRKKVAGLLLELHRHQGRDHLAIGIGINVVSHPSDTPYPATDLTAHGAPCDTQMLVAAIDEQFNLWCGYGLSHGFGIIRNAWLETAAGLGEAITVRLPDREVKGIFRTIDQNGALVLAVSKGAAERGEREIVIDTGDVFLSPT